MFKNMLNNLVIWFASRFAKIAANNFDKLAKLTGGKTTEDMANQVKVIVADLNKQAEGLMNEAETIVQKSDQELAEAIRLAELKANNERKLASAKNAAASKLLDQSAEALEAVEFFSSKSDQA